MSVIIVTWNAAPVLAACLDSIERQVVPGGFETVVVDNASTDDTAALLERYRDRIRIVTNDHNAEFSRANNLGARNAHGRVLFFLNSDTELHGTDTLRRLVEAAEAEEVGLVGPRLLNPDGTLQPSCAALPGVLKAALLATGIHRLLPDRLAARVLPERWSHSCSRDTGWVMGAAFAIRADVFWRLGGLWLVRYAEETELAYRVRRAGLRVRFDNSATVTHIGNFSFGQRWSEPERQAKIAKAELALLRSHYPRLRATAIRTIMLGGYSGRVVVHRLLRRPAKAAVYREMTRVYAAPAPTPGSLDPG